MPNSHAAAHHSHDEHAAQLAQTGTEVVHAETVQMAQSLASAVHAGTVTTSLSAVMINISKL